ncbi:hypothetical protein [Paraburkholderia strydomiana]|uniref:hypothetical protein n=1 Tax=Paraburkholderia strydomiana TaxID=1245417 RepID=UPI001BE58F50|nr:hypothetical protein [Paraburkholderia strydomiana]MBT2795283.1 hypothetical protein [Paraburkholderia strydomiana]
MHRTQQFFGEPGVQTCRTALHDSGFLSGNQIDSEPEMPVGSQQMGLFVNE